MKPLQLGISLALALMLLTAFTSTILAEDSTQGELTVFCAASLTDAVGEIAQTFGDTYDENVITNFDGTQAIRAQIEQGAYADVFISANKKHIDALMAEGYMDNDTVKVFTENSMTVIVPRDNPGEIYNLSDLSRPGLKIVIGIKEVPVGGYALEILDKLAADPAYGEEYKEAVMNNVVSQETTVNYVVSKVALGEADAGFVYKSDVSPSLADKITRIEIPAQYNVVCEYLLGVLKGSDRPDVAREFVDFVTSSDGKDILSKYGFDPV